MSEWGQARDRIERAARYRLRAQQIRAIADDVRKAETKQLLEQMAAEWEHMAAAQDEKAIRLSSELTPPRSEPEPAGPS
jgi:hypothetical protein